ncbi:MAG: Uma2 family endonuclease [Caldilinea sp. CFX5]|nr:Uma2 family endonuclease [Caldilinea sp. CFX5]
MSTKILDPTPRISMQRTQIANGVYDATTATATSPVNGTHEFLPDLPTFPLEAGWRTVYDAATERYLQQPLTLLDILYPSEDDVGVVYMAQSPLHNLLTDLLSVMLSTYLGARDWLILHDVLVLWGVRGIPPKSPDLAAIPGGRRPIDEKSYRVGRDGPIPAFVIEVTSTETRNEDLDNKPLHYAALGIKEFLIIDILNETTGDWDLIGYRLEDGPYYRRLSLDAEKGITFTTVGLRFVAVNRTRIEVYDSATGQRLLTSQELKTQAEAQAARAAELEKRVRELESQLGIQSTTPTTD